ncbi:GntR family transcriptional regulator [Marinibaculum pumilum]|uniref:GntR family transcriptional regulator n=1 Tax=Marinibaculum pumilum TaxID=1766165 RepID=A0ABV7KV66_9PROT
MPLPPMSLPAPPADLEARHPHRHDRAFAYMRHLLLDGGLEPGQAISSEGVAAALDISRAPVTDAIKRLVGDGFLTVIPQVGCRVNAPGPRDVADFFRLFARAEAVILGLAAERRSDAEAEALDRLAADLERDFRALRKADSGGPALRALNRRRYEALHAIAGSPIAGDLVANMWDRSDFYIRIAYGAFVQAAAVHRANQAICRAVIAGDPAAAMAATEDYLAKVGEATADRLAAADQPSRTVALGLDPRAHSASGAARRRMRNGSSGRARG